MLNSQVSGVAIQLDCATLSHWSPANCKSRFQILSPHSGGSICRFWYSQSSDPPVYPLFAGHHWDSTSLVWILSHWSVFQGGLGKGGIQSTSIGHWGSPGLCSWTPPLLHIHYITGSHHTGTWLLLPFLRWWHTALSLILTRWPNGSCTYLRLPGRHLGMDERTSPTAQPGKDWASCLPCQSNSTAWLHDSVRFINNYPISFSQKSWCNLWWPADLQRAHCKDCSILQVCTSQHQKDQALSDRACCTTSCPGPCHFQAGLLQCSSGWTSIKHDQTSTNDSECSGITGLQRAQKSPCYTSIYLLALAPGCSLHQVQDTDACIKNTHRLSTRPLPLTINRNLHLL